MPLTTPTFDVNEIPFSRRGSWLNLSLVVALHTTVDDVHLVSHQTGMHAMLALVPELGGRRADAEVSATPSALTWTLDNGETIQAVFERGDVLRLRGSGAGLRVTDAAPGLTPFTGTYMVEDPDGNSVVFTSYETGRRYRITPLTSKLSHVGAEALGLHERSILIGGEGGPWEAVIEEFETARPPYSATVTFPRARAAVAEEFETYLDTVAGWRTPETPAAELAAYVLWSATVAPEGFLQRESVLMSKHWMDKVWSWDHCFNAIALSDLPTLAWDQFHVPFDHMDPTGALPDSVTHSEILYNFVKPPIHGWAFGRLRAKAGPLSEQELRVAYGRLLAWTRFWLEQRRIAGHPLPYYQHGNDSGWDNSTTFDRDRLIESPDLAAFLLVQLDALIQLAAELDEDAEGLRIEYDAIREALMAKLWRGDHFVAVGAQSGRDSKSSSLLNLLPILAAEHLDDATVSFLVEGIRRHLTEFGPATQLVESPEYEADGYWRGPIWAPSTILIEDGLRRAGATELADEVSSRFRRLCELSGFAENFNALTGEGLRDRAYTWTASAYLILARESEQRRRSSPDDRPEIVAHVAAPTVS